MVVDHSCPLVSVEYPEGPLCAQDGTLDVFCDYIRMETWKPANVFAASLESLGTRNLALRNN